MLVIDGSLGIPSYSILSKRTIAKLSVKSVVDFYIVTKLIQCLSKSNDTVVLYK